MFCLYLGSIYGDSLNVEAEMDWNKLGATGSLLGGVFGALIFFSQVWPLPQIRQRRAHQPIQPLTPPLKWIGALLILSFAMSTAAIFGAWPAPKPERLPNMLIGWTGADKGCLAVVDTTWIASLKDKYHLFVVCHIPNPSVDELENTTIAVSAPFAITGGAVTIRIDYKASSEIRKLAKPGTLTNLSIVILPKDQDGSNIHKLGDVLRVGGAILVAGSKLP